MNTLKLIHWNKALSLLNKLDYSNAIISENYGKIEDELYGKGLFKVIIPDENVYITLHMCELTGRLYGVIIHTNEGYYPFTCKQLNNKRIFSFMKKVYDGMIAPIQDIVYVTEGCRLHRFLDSLCRYVTKNRMPLNKMRIIQ